jgi:hypothetical protein
LQPATKHVEKHKLQKTQKWIHQMQKHIPNHTVTEKCMQLHVFGASSSTAQTKAKHRDQ